MTATARSPQPTVDAPAAKCGQAGCERATHGLGLCKSHYQDAWSARALVPSQEYVRTLANLGAEIIGITADSVMSRSQAHQPSHVRQALMYVLGQRGWTTPGIGRALSRNHSSVSHAWRNVPLRAALDPDYAYLVRRLDEASRLAAPPENEADPEPWVRAQLAGVEEVIRQAEAMRRDLEQTLRVLRDSQELVITRGAGRQLQEVAS